MQAIGVVSLLLALERYATENTKSQLYSWKTVG